MIHSLFVHVLCLFLFQCFDYWCVLAAYRDDQMFFVCFDSDSFFCLFNVLLIWQRTIFGNLKKKCQNQILRSILRGKTKWERNKIISDILFLPTILRWRATAWQAAALVGDVSLLRGKGSSEQHRLMLVRATSWERPKQTMTAALRSFKMLGKNTETP